MTKDDEYFRSILLKVEHDFEFGMNCCREDMLVAALKKAYQDGVEDAAKVADSYQHDFIGKAIRELARDK